MEIQNILQVIVYFKKSSETQCSRPGKALDQDEQKVLV